MLRLVVVYTTHKMNGRTSYGLQTFPVRSVTDNGQPFSEQIEGMDSAVNSLIPNQPGENEVGIIGLRLNVKSLDVDRRVNDFRISLVKPPDPFLDAARDGNEVVDLLSTPIIGSSQ